MLPIDSDRETAGIADAVRLYNAAYTLAWDQLVAHRMTSLGASSRLSANVRALIKAGRDDSLAIAAEAVDQMRRNPSP